MEYVRRHANDCTHFVGFSFAGVEFGRSSNETQHEKEWECEPRDDPLH